MLEPKITKYDITNSNKWAVGEITLSIHVRGLGKTIPLDEYTDLINRIESVLEPMRADFKNSRRG